MLNKILTSDLLKNKKVILKIMLLDTPFEVGEIIDIKQEIIDKLWQKIDIFSCQIIQNNIVIGEEYKYLVKHRSSIKKILYIDFLATYTKNLDTIEYIFDSNIYPSYMKKLII